MNIFWVPVLKPLLKAAGAKHIIEIGAYKGQNSLRLARWCAANGAVADIIDPLPAFDSQAFNDAHEGIAKVHLGTSLDVLGSLPKPDVVFVDGDHNWYTVYHEIRLLIGSPAAPVAQPPILVFHDTAWPWARRDAYYDITRIPPEDRQPHGRGQISPKSKGWSPEGMAYDLDCAKEQGGAKNGVLTAITDAFAGLEDQFEFCSLSMFQGLTLAVPKDRLRQSPALAELLEDLAPSGTLKSLIDLLEHSRLEALTAAQMIYQIMGSRTEIPTVAPDERPLQTALNAEVWQGLQKGMLGQRYKGRSFILHPFDQYNYLSLIETMRPATIFEIGSYQGGRALWMADQLRAFGIDGRVLALDLAPPKGISDPLVEVMAANAMDLGETLTPERLAALPRPWLVIEDAAHTCPMSLAVLRFFDPYLNAGDRIIVEDGNIGSLSGQPEVSPPHEAMKTFLADRGSAYRLETEFCDRYGYNLTANPNGWLVRL